MDQSRYAGNSDGSGRMVRAEAGHQLMYEGLCVSTKHIGTVCVGNAQTHPD